MKLNILELHISKNQSSNTNIFPHKKKKREGDGIKNTIFLIYANQLLGTIFILEISP